MAENWESYLCLMDGHPASVLLDLGMRDVAPLGDLSMTLVVWLRMLEPRKDGLSDASEFSALVAIEDELVARLETEFGAKHVASVTTQGQRQFLFYARSAETLGTAVGGVARHFPPYSLTCSARPDPNWSIYLDGLYPSPRNRQFIFNRRVFRSLKAKGETLALPRSVRHWAYFPSGEARRTFLERLAGECYSHKLSDVPRHEGGGHPFGVILTRRQVLSESGMDAETLMLFDLAAELGGDYDGWETDLLQA